MEFVILYAPRFKKCFCTLVSVCFFFFFLLLNVKKNNKNKKKDFKAFFFFFNDKFPVNL